MQDVRTIAGFPCRPGSLADAGAVIELINEAEVLDVGEAILEQSDIEADWASQSIDLDSDTLIVLDGDDLAAVGQVNAERADIWVRPSYRSRGIGIGLLRWSEDRARSQAAPGTEARVGQTVLSDSDAAALLKREGYEPLWDSWVLRLEPEATLTPRPIPGVEIRPYRPDEEPEIHAVVDGAFSEWPGRSPQPLAAWRERVVKRPDFDPSLLLVATADNRLVGAAFGINYSTEGWVEQVAVAPSHRNQGIASALLAALHEEFKSRGQHGFGLNTDSRTGALDLYLRLGMEVKLSFTRWSRVL